MTSGGGAGQAGLASGNVPAEAVPFEVLLEPLLDTAYRAALRFTRNTSDAEDLVQEAALLAFRGYHSFVPGSSFRAWFLRILTNCFFSRYRKRKRRGDEIDLDDTPELFLYCQAASHGMLGRVEDPAGLMMSKLEAEQVEAALAALPEEFRVVATLYFLQDFSYQEIAEMIGVPVGTVRSRLHRGRRMLQKALWTLAQERGIVALPIEVGGGEG